MGGINNVKGGGRPNPVEPAGPADGEVAVPASVDGRAAYVPAAGGDVYRMANYNRATLSTGRPLNALPIARPDRVVGDPVEVRLAKACFEAFVGVVTEMMQKDDSGPQARENA